MVEKKKTKGVGEQRVKERGANGSDEGTGQRRDYLTPKSVGTVGVCGDNDTREHSYPVHCF